MIEREWSGPVVVLRFDHGKANTLDTELLSALADELAALEASPDARAVVLTGKGKVFSAGVDLVRLLEGGAAYLESFLPALTDTLDRLFRFPRPVVAAVNGHAVGGGCLIACAADRRLMAQGDGRIGAPELLVGLPGPLVGIEALRAASPGHVDEIVHLGATYRADEARQLGLIHDVVPAEELLERALRQAETLGRIAPAAFATTKEDLRRPALERLERLAKSHHEMIAPQWSSPAALDAVRSYVERTLRRS